MDDGFSIGTKHVICQKHCLRKSIILLMNNNKGNQRKPEETVLREQSMIKNVTKEYTLDYSC